MLMMKNEMTKSFFSSWISLAFSFAFSSLIDALMMDDWLMSREAGGRWGLISVQLSLIAELLWLSRTHAYIIVFIRMIHASYIR